MKVRFNVKYLSIGQFREVDLPAFTVLTGINGSGKTQLTLAMKAGNVAIEGISPDEIVRFDNSSFALDSEQEVDFRHLSDLRQSILKAIQELNPRNYLPIDTRVGQHVRHLASKLAIPYYRLTREDFINDGIESDYGAYFNHTVQLYQGIKNRHSGTDPLRTNPGILRLWEISPKALDDLTIEDLHQLYRPISLKNNFLLQQLGALFSDYWQKWEENQYNHFRNNGNPGLLPVLSPEEFRNRYGDKPWDLVNRILARFSSLDYQVNNPEGLHRDDRFHLRLYSKADPTLHIDFQQLSSGEKTMMALASCLLKAAIDRSFPKLLILDEIDASLHPSMIKNMIDTLDTVLVREKGIKVLLVTHSPSTVALAPANSLFMMNRSGEERLAASSNREALHLLTEGFASLTLDDSHLRIDYTIRHASRFVLLTEGITDRIILESAWKALEPTAPHFDIQDCFDASFLRNLIKRGEIFRNYPSKRFLAVFDFDSEGYSSWNQLTDFDLIEINPRKGLLKKHRRHDAYALLLPVPPALESQTIRSGNDTFEEKAHLPIELLFHGAPEAAPHFIHEPQPGGGSIIKFNGNKVPFAQDVSARFPPAVFIHFKPIVSVLNSIFSR